MCLCVWQFDHSSHDFDYMIHIIDNYTHITNEILGFKSYHFHEFLLYTLTHGHMHIKVYLLSYACFCCPFFSFPILASWSSSTCEEGNSVTIMSCKFFKLLVGEWQTKLVIFFYSFFYVFVCFVLPSICCKSYLFCVTFSC